MDTLLHGSGRKDRKRKRPRINNSVRPGGFFVITCIILDLFTKILAQQVLQTKGSVHILGNFFRLTYVENTGAAFGQFQDQSLLLSILALICIGVLIGFLRQASCFLERAGIALILAGAVGNCIDRLFRGYVIDFLDFDFLDIHCENFAGMTGLHLERWPVFNFADSYICIGTGLLIGFLFFKRGVTQA